MNTNETLLGVVADICTLSFLLVGEEGSERALECENGEQFQRVLNYCYACGADVEWAEIALTTDW
jgi:hypothetical protein